MNEDEACSTHTKAKNKVNLRSENLKRKDHLESVRVDDRAIINTIYRNRVGGCGMDSYGSRQGQCGCFAHNHKHSDLEDVGISWQTWG
jgi:hypothetical protein